MQPVPLSPIDYVFTGVGSYPITFAFAYARSLDPAHVRGSLDETLAHFPLLRTKLIRVAGDAYAFSPAEGGLSFEVNQSGETFADASDLDGFVSPVVSSEDQPLTRIRCQVDNLLRSAVRMLKKDGLGQKDVYEQKKAA